MPRKQKGGINRTGMYMPTQAGGAAAIQEYRAMKGRGMSDAAIKKQKGKGFFDFVKKAIDWGKNAAGTVGNIARKVATVANSDAVKKFVPFAGSVGEVADKLASATGNGKKRGRGKRIILV